MTQTVALWDVDQNRVSTVGKGGPLIFRTVTGEIPEAFLISGPDILFDDGTAQTALHENPEYHPLRPITFIPTDPSDLFGVIRSDWYCLKCKNKRIYLTVDNIGYGWEVHTFPDLVALLLQEYYMIKPLDEQYDRILW
jgi:hypothetical protein